MLDITAKDEAWQTSPQASEYFKPQMMVFVLLYMIANEMCE
jgi:hypothetical protein